MSGEGGRDYHFIHIRPILQLYIYSVIPLVLRISNNFRSDAVHALKKTFLYKVILSELLPLAQVTGVGQENPDKKWSHFDS